MKYRPSIELLLFGIEADVGFTFPFARETQGNVSLVLVGDLLVDRLGIAPSDIPVDGDRTGATGDLDLLIIGERHLPIPLDTPMSAGPIIPRSGTMFLDDRGHLFIGDLLATLRSVTPDAQLLPGPPVPRSSRGEREEYGRHRLERLQKALLQFDGLDQSLPELVEVFLGTRDGDTIANPVWHDSILSIVKERFTLR